MEYIKVAIDYIGTVLSYMGFGLDYIGITTAIVSILNFLLGALTLHFFLFGIVGVFFKKKFPRADKQLKYCIVISARNEEAVIGNLVDSVYKNDYPRDKIEIFVVAHNCTDRTADAARAAGAHVYEYNNDNERTKGYALRYLFKCINRDYNIDEFAGVFVMDSDNVLEEHYIQKMNDAFVAGNEKNIITSFRHSKNFGSNLMSAMYGLYFVYGCRMESRGRSVLGCSTRVSGTGYLVPIDAIKGEWPYVTLTEDWEFTADQILKGTRIVYCDEAVFYDEQPTSIRVMCRQRIRWAKGHLLVCLSRLGDLFKALILPKRWGGAKRRGSTYDIFVNILPICFIGTAIVLLEVLFMLIALFIGEDFLQMLHNFGFGKLTAAAGAYLVLLFASFFVYIIEHKRIRNISAGLKIVSAIVWPFFLAFSVPAELISLFIRNLGWKVIPHTDTTSFSELNGSKESSAQVKFEQEAPQDNIEAIEVVRPEMAEVK